VAGYQRSVGVAIADSGIGPRPVGTSVAGRDRHARLGDHRGDLARSEPVATAIAAWAIIHGRVNLPIDMGGADPDHPPDGPMAGRTADQVLGAVVRAASEGMRVR
jgi:hypothetical protein